LVEATYADAATIKTACGKGLPKPRDAVGELVSGDANVKSGRLIIDLVTRKVPPQQQ
jgi:hypothetical protein